MTINGLYKILGKLIADGEGRAIVAVNKDTFSDNRESVSTKGLLVSDQSLRERLADKMCGCLGPGTDSEMREVMRNE